MAEQLAEVSDLLDLLPVAAAVFVDGRPGVGNAALSDLLGSGADGLRSGWFDEGDRRGLDDLVDEAAGSALLRWGSTYPLISVVAHARRIDERSVLVVFVDDSEAARLDAILTALDNAVLVADDRRRLRATTRGMRAAYGEPAALGTDVMAPMHPDDVEGAVEQFNAALASPRRKLHYTGRVHHEDFPDVWWMLDMVTVNLLDDPAIGGVVTAFGPHMTHEGTDDTERADTMRLSDIMPVGVVQAGRSGTCYFRNHLSVHHLGPIERGDPPERWIARARDEDQDGLWRALKEAEAGRRSDPVVVCFPQSDGSPGWFRVEFSPHLTRSGESVGWVATTLDVTAETEARQELHDAQQRLWHLANHDALTGLPNRPAMLDRIDSALARQRRDGHGVALLYCDLDGFKPVNDTYGHEMGDRVLCEVARRMRAEVRDTDTVGRFGGDEFVVLCESFSDESEMVEIERRIADRVAAPIEEAGAAIVVGVTIGSVLAQADDTTSTLLARADGLMYAAKRGR